MDATRDTVATAVAGTIGRPPPQLVERLVPVVARVLELGRGPPPLVDWVCRQLDGLEPRPVATAEYLAGRLVRLLEANAIGGPLAQVIDRILKPNGHDPPG